MTKPEPIRPHFEHDCDACEYLGEHLGVDLYYCRDPREEGWGTAGSVISRRSSRGPDYASSDLSILRRVRDREEPTYDEDRPLYVGLWRVESKKLAMELAEHGSET